MTSTSSASTAGRSCSRTTTRPRSSCSTSRRAPGASCTTARACRAGDTVGAMRVVFLSPRYPPEMRQFTRGLAEVGAAVLGVGDGSPDPELRRYLTDYLEVPSIMNEDDVIARVHHWLRGRTVDRILANWEPLVIVAARMRERFGMPGMSVDAVRG